MCTCTQCPTHSLADFSDFFPASPSKSDTIGTNDATQFLDLMVSQMQAHGLVSEEAHQIGTPPFVFSTLPPLNVTPLFIAPALGSPELFQASQDSLSPADMSGEKLVCNQCGSEFKRVDALRRHQKMAVEKYNGKCRAKRGRMSKEEHELLQDFKRARKD
jgi:uncharacterized C2H2 Zn-finger protein